MVFCQVLYCVSEAGQWGGGRGCSKDELVLFCEGGKGFLVFTSGVKQNNS